MLIKSVESKPEKMYKIGFKYFMLENSIGHFENFFLRKQYVRHFFEFSQKKKKRV